MSVRDDGRMVAEINAWKDDDRPDGKRIRRWRHESGDSAFPVEKLSFVLWNFLEKVTHWGQESLETVSEVAS